MIVCHGRTGRTLEDEGMDEEARSEDARRKRYFPSTTDWSLVIFDYVTTATSMLLS